MFEEETWNIESEVVFKDNCNFIINIRDHLNNINGNINLT